MGEMTLEEFKELMAKANRTFLHHNEAAYLIQSFGDLHKRVEKAEAEVETLTREHDRIATIGEGLEYERDALQSDLAALRLREARLVERGKALIDKIQLVFEVPDYEAALRGYRGPMFWKELDAFKAALDGDKPGEG